MHLNANTVKLHIGGSRRPGTEQSRRNIRSTGRKHRRQSSADPKADIGKSGSTPGKRGNSHLLEIPGEQQRPAYGNKRNPGSLSNRIGEQSGLRPLPQFPAEEPHEQPLLITGS